MHLKDIFIKTAFCSFIVLIHFNGAAQTETSGSYKVILESIENLESTKDPKCHATASRLEDFIYGTPLTDEAREYRMELQKDIVRHIWTEASTADGVVRISLDRLGRATDRLIQFLVKDNEWYLVLSDGDRISISQRDYKHYASIAYGLRAVLAIQQEDLFGDGILLPLDEAAVERLKLLIDIITVGLLKIADEKSRLENRYDITEDDLKHAWGLISHRPLLPPSTSTSTSKAANFDLTSAVINQKLASYEAYNQLSQKVFLRNIQVYFAQVPWPKDSLKSMELTKSFQDVVLTFTSKFFLDAQGFVLKANEPFVRHEDVRRSLHQLLPYSINQFEDVTYFPMLQEKNITIESYDLDAFRDSGVHWNYLGAALKNSSENLKLEPDPNALELLVEGIAQMGVLVWRLAGRIAKEEEAQVLDPSHIESAFETIKSLSVEHGQIPMDISQETENKVTKSSSISIERTGTLFSDVTAYTGINFEHRTSDWLSRQIRSYAVKSDENLARLAIPPAFGGGGVGAEDVNGDGLTDILLLGGKGNRLFLNQGDKTFEDVTTTSGLDWKREDGTYGEPRQPIISDFNNDGLLDIFISYANDHHKIFKGNGDGTFSDMSEDAGLGGEGLVGGPCTALDFDKDGLLDIYIGYFGNYLKGELPTLKRHNENGSPNKLFRNMGNFQFKDVTSGSGLANTGWTQAVGHADIDDDGWQDVIVGNDFGINSYYINNGDGTFTDKSKELGVDKPSYTMNIGFTDLNADDLPDFYISNIVVMEKDDKYTSPNAETTMHFNPKVLANMRVVEANDLFISVKNKSKQSYELSKSIGRGYSSTGWAWDADFFDYDNDGDEDLYCLNGMNQYSVYGADNPYYANPEGETIEAFFSQSQSAENVFFENNEGFLQNRSLGSGLNFEYTSRSAAYLDYDNDGDLDVIVNNYNGPAYFFENSSEELNNNWLIIDLRNNPKSKIETLVGTKVKISTPDGKKIWRQVSSTTGYLSVHPSKIYVGLGKEKECKVEVIWPDGKKKKLDFKKVNDSYALKRDGTLSLIE